MRIIITSNSNPKLVDMFRKAYHKASGNKGFCNPDVIYREEG